jgi:hypothetical protein
MIINFEIYRENNKITKEYLIFNFFLIINYQFDSKKKKENYY